jgi:hypothetical protein
MECWISRRYESADAEAVAAKVLAELVRPDSLRNTVSHFTHTVEHMN